MSMVYLYSILLGNSYTFHEKHCFLREKQQLPSSVGVAMGVPVSSLQDKGKGIERREGQLVQ